MLASATLVSNIGLGAIKAWRTGDFKKLDPTGGDGACQIRGYLLPIFLTERTLQEEAFPLEAKCAEIKEIVNRRKADGCNKKGLKLSPPGAFFQEQFAPINVSKKLEFIFQSFLLNATRQKRPQLPNGIQSHTSEECLLKKLSTDISSVDLKSRWKIIECAQAHLSANSVALLRPEAEQTTSFGAEEKKHLLMMLSPERTRTWSLKDDTGEPLYELKTFGPILYEYKAILARLREKKALVCFKSIVPPGGKPFHLLLQPKEAGGEFAVVPDETTPGLPDLGAPVPVFEGAVGSVFDRASFAARVNEIGFTKLVLVTAAIEAPYWPKSDLDALKDPIAQEEVLRYRDEAVRIQCEKGNPDPLLMLDHVYANAPRNELS